MAQIINSNNFEALVATGNHAKIEAWRLRNALAKTAENRPDLLSTIPPAFWEEMQ